MKTTGTKRKYIKAETMETKEASKAFNKSKGYEESFYMLTSKTGMVGIALKAGDTYHITAEA